MYQYDTFDRQLVQERVADFREQTARYLAGELGEEEFKPLRLMNGLYFQRFAPMLRVAIPYGILSSTQLRMLASVATRYDRGYGHFTTRQNIQFNWPALERVPDILADLASVDMHAIQTSGNCIRNITCDHLAGIAPDEIADPVYEPNHVSGPNFPTLNIGPNTSIRLPGGIYISAAGEFKGGHYLRDSNVHPGGITRGAKMPLCWPYYEDKANNTNITLLDSTPALWRARCTPTLIRRIGLVWDADFFRLRSLSAQVPVDFVFPERISSALLTLALNNSYTWKRMPYLDPEMRGNQGGIDLAQAIAARNPTPISFRASLRIQF